MLLKPIMDLKYFGHSSFFVRSKDAKLVMDPFDPKMVGLKFPKTESDIVSISHHHGDHNHIAEIASGTLVIDMPGEYEKNGMRITGYLSYHDKKKGAERGENIIYKVEGDGVSLLHCGDLGMVPDDAFIDQLGEIDVLLVPVGGFFTIDANDAVELVKKVEPSIVIPMHFGNPKMNPQLLEKLAPVSDFLKKIGSEGVTPIPRLTLKKEEFAEEMKVIVMEISN